MGVIIDAFKSNFSDGYQFGDVFHSLTGNSLKNPVHDISSAAKTFNINGPKTFEQYSGISDPYSIGSRIDNFFTGKVTSAEKAYQNYLADYEFKRNAEASAKANQETWAREDSQIQRLMEDYQKAGLNPYLLLSGGNLSSGVVSSQSQKPTYKKKSLEEGKVESKLMNTAVKVLALLLLKKAM